MRGQFFDDFLVGQKTFPEGYDHPRVLRFTLPGLLLGVGGINKDNPATDCLTRLWADGPANKSLSLSLSIYIYIYTYTHTHVEAYAI